ncbi:MAG TPA: dockerin type I repeat-containing protein, partial [Clostridia bacterium]
NSTDYVLLKRYVLEMSVNIEVKAADLNGDTKINSADCSLLKQYLLDKISKFPADK